MLSRRLAVACALTGVVAAPIVPAVFAADAPLPAAPQAGCFNFTDPKGDAAFVAFGSDELDITGVALETTATSLIGFAQMPALSQDGPGAPFDGQRLTLKFTFNNHVFSASGSAYAHGTGAIRDGLAETGQAAHTTQLGVDTPPIDPTNPDPALVTSKGFVDSGLKVTFDYKNKWVIWDLPIADIEKYGQAKFTGNITQVGAQAQTDEYAIGSVWDSAPDTDDNGDLTGTWTVGDNKCFGGSSSAASAVLKYIGDRTAAYGAPANVSASVADASGKPVAGAPVTFAIGKLQTSAKTNAKGIAAATLHPTLVAGHYTLVTTTPNGDSGTTTVKTRFVVSLAKTVIKLSKSGTKVTALLTDAAKHALAGQKIAWTVNGKSARATTTNKAGRAVLKAAKGDHVVASFKAVKGKYAGSTAKTTV